MDQKLQHLITEDKLTYRYAEGKWTIKEVVAHLIDMERIYTYRDCVLQETIKPYYRALMLTICFVFRRPTTKIFCTCWASLKLFGMRPLLF